MADSSDHNDVLRTPAPVFSRDEIRKIADQIFGLTGALKQLDSERDLNYHLTTENNNQYVIKIANSAEDRAIIDMQLKALEHIALVDPALPVPTVYLSHSGKTIEQIQSRDGRDHSIRIVSYLPGVQPKDDYTDSDFYIHMGRLLAQLTRALQGFFHPAANYELLWDLKNTSQLRMYLEYIQNSQYLDLVTYFIDRFDKNVGPVIPELRAQIVHNDMVPDNLLVSEKEPDRIVGIIDFGDLVHTSLVIDLATTIAATLRKTDDLVDVAAMIVSGYNDVIPLEKDELHILYDLIGARLAMLNVIASWRVTLHPENRDYIMGGVEETWRILDLWRKQEPLEVRKTFLRSCGHWEYEDINKDSTYQDQTIELLLTRRERLLGPCAYLFYEDPLHIVRGKGVWLYDHTGKRYLDAYNNVPHVGHCHPHVVKAISRQSRLLNTSTRYLHENILELAERITDRLPEPLSVCMFVCTGSEANELAWRMARLVSGHQGALITKYSYHGSTSATAQFSTESLAEENLPSHVQTFYPPLSNTGWQQPDSGISTAVEGLKENGHQPAMLLLDTSFVSDGIFTAPKDYLSTLVHKTRNAGGLFVADEVQGGFGRLGAEFWGFEFDDVTPDIVTMGKPMGNGHPLAAVVTRPAIAEALARETGYFNTFGGNPVSCAAGLAVLDVLEQEDLQQNALIVGTYIISKLTDLQKRDPRLGPVNGSGLLLGVDILTRDGKQDPLLAGRIMNHMRQNGVLIGITGPRSHVLKIRPPLVFETEHADMLLDAVEKALTEL